MIISTRDGKKFRLTGLYREPDRSKRRETWALIRTLTDRNSFPWAIIGDMNNVVSQEDKRGGRVYPQWLIQGFRDIIDDCALIDMPLIGYPFTWERCRGTENWVEVRLDRALVSESFLHLSKGAKLINLEVLEWGGETNWKKKWSNISLIFSKLLTLNGVRLQAAS
ncbi:hypothetical protein POM88_027426 [Heracleum sosnowskyi]|uniref:Endonuclease/exonuclease/phosphatase domain-containing protein n=1 Tax=Heracleum sosnowskyi TaxID=360622 RepID=A0AAD8I9X8_9APIA|nr:hypothetical protein POM88_027426 [Heracleum sosnowskyi]